MTPGKRYCCRVATTACCHGSSGATGLAGEIKRDEAGASIRSDIRSGGNRRRTVWLRWTPCALGLWYARASRTCLTARLGALGRSQISSQKPNDPATKLGGRLSNMRVQLAAVAFLLLGICRADAECVCQCTDGQMEPLCQNAIDLPPICPPTICPTMAPSIAPIAPSTIPPLGTSQCRQASVCDTFGNCQWQRVCN